MTRAPASASPGTQFKRLCRRLNVKLWPLRMFNKTKYLMKACFVTAMADNMYAPHVQDEFLAWARVFKAVLVRRRGPKASGIWGGA